MTHKVLLKNVRLTYANLFEPRPVSKEPDAALKYGTAMIIPKDHPQVADLKKAIKDAAIDKFGDKAKTVLGKKNPLRDGDATDDDGERIDDDPLTVGCYTMNSSSKRKPQVVDRQVQPILTDAEAYSGCWGNVSLAFYGFDVDVNKGVGVGLNNVQIVKEDERLGGAPNAEDEFGVVESDDEDDDFSF